MKTYRGFQISTNTTTATRKELDRAFINAFPTETPNFEKSDKDRIKEAKDEAIRRGVKAIDICYYYFNGPKVAIKRNYNV